jgi:hypothetical protein
MGLILALAVVGLTGIWWGLDVGIGIGVLAWMAWIVWGDYRGWKGRKEAIEGRDR